MKITAHRKVWWDANGKELTGKVKQTFVTHALVKGENCDYMVPMASLRTSPREARS
jgi:hypothetical protein